MTPRPLKSPGNPPDRIALRAISMAPGDLTGPRAPPTTTCARIFSMSTGDVMSEEAAPETQPAAKTADKEADAGFAPSGRRYPRALP